MAKLYNCNNCPAYCCSYEEIVITKSDIKRLASWFEISRFAAAIPVPPAAAIMIF